MIYFVDTTTNRLFLEFVDGITVKQFLYDNHPQNDKGKKKDSRLNNFFIFYI